MCKFKFGRNHNKKGESSSDCCFWSSKRLIMTVINRPCKLCRRLSNRYKIEKALLIPSGGKEGSGDKLKERCVESGNTVSNVNASATSEVEKSLLFSLQCGNGSDISAKCSGVAEKPETPDKTEKVSGPSK